MQYDLCDRFQGWELCEHVAPEARVSPAELGTDGPLVSWPNEFMDPVFEKAFGK